MVRHHPLCEATGSSVYVSPRLPCSLEPVTVTILGSAELTIEFAAQAFQLLPALLSEPLTKSLPLRITFSEPSRSFQLRLNQLHFKLHITILKSEISSYLVQYVNFAQFPTIQSPP